MNYEQGGKLLLLLLCIGGETLGALLPGGGPVGYQYNRPGGPGGDGGGPSAGGFDFGGGGFRGRPSSTYGTPGTGGGSGGGFGGRTYLTPQFGGSGVPGISGGGGSGIGGGGGSGGGSGSGGGGGGGAGYQGNFGFPPDGGRPQPYSFQYEVYDPPSGNDYSQRESSDGSIVQGEYRVLLPDSRTQIVKYMADDINGYTADVQYEGQAQFTRNGIGGGGGYQTGGTDGGYQSGRPRGFGGFTGGDGSSNQYLPPRK